MQFTCPSCPSCNNYVPPSGSKSARIAIIGEAPGEEELKQKTPFVGPAGKLLWEELGALGIRREDCWVYNAVPCIDLSKGRTPSPTVIKRWRPHVLDELKSTSAELVLLLGRIAVCSVLNRKPGDFRISDINATVLNVDLEGRAVKCVPTVHPSSVLRSNFSERYVKALKSGLRKAVQVLRGEGVTEESWYKGYKVVTKMDDFGDIRDAIELDGRVVIDVEDVRDGGVSKGLLIGLYVPIGKCLVYSIPVGEWYKDELGYSSRDVTEFLIWMFGSASKGNRIIGHNVNYDVKILRSNGLLPDGYYATDDTMLMAHLLDPRRWGALSLKDVGKELFSVEPYWVEARQAMSKGLAHLPPEKVFEYNGRDCALTYRVFEHLSRQLEEDKRLFKFYRELLMPVNRILLGIETNGLLVSKDTARLLLERWNNELREVEKQLKEYGQDINWRSPKQVGELLYSKLGLPVVDTTGRGQWSTSEDTLRKLEGLHPVVGLLLRHREIRKSVETLESLCKTIADDGRIHPTFNLTGTVSGRSSSTPNVQNFDRDSGIRDIVVAPPGYKLVEADLSQIELRWLAVMYRENTLQSALTSGRDIHMETARLAFNKDASQITSEERVLGKTVNFSSGYGASPYKIASILRRSVTRERAAGILGGASDSQDPVLELAKRLHSAFHTQFPRVRVAWQEIRDRLRAVGFVESAFGRRFRVSSDSQSDDVVREASNFVVQSSAADTLWLCLRDVYEVARSLGARIVNVVHDSILAEVPESNVEEYAGRVLAIMRGPRFADFGVNMPVSVDAEVKVGDSWGRMEKIGVSPPQNEDEYSVSLRKHVDVYVKNRWCVVPALPGEKFPAQEWAGATFRVPSDGEVKVWATAKVNVGILTGRRSMLVVVDADAKNGGIETIHHLGIDSSVKVRTGGGGLHLYYRYPDIDKSYKLSSKIGIFPGVDVRADGGFVVAPPSVHPSGNRYVFECDLSSVSVDVLPEVPGVILEKILDRGKTDFGPGKATELGPTWSKELTQEAIDKIVTALAPVWNQGYRHNASLYLVGALAKRGYRVDDVVRLVETLADVTGDSELRDRLRTVESTYGRLQSGESINGISGLRELFGEEVAREILDVIGSYRRIHDVECFTLGEFSDSSVYTPEWVVEKLLPVEGFAQLAGHPGAGKTTLAIQLAAQLAAGNPFLGKFTVPKPRRTLYLQADNPPAMMREIIEEVVKREPASRDNVVMAHVRNPVHLDEEVGFETISELCRIYRPDLVIFDTIRDFHTANELDPNAAAAVVSAIDKLRAKHCVAVIFINHLSKSLGFKRAAIEAHMGTMRWVTKADLDILLEDVSLDTSNNGDYVKLVFAKVRWSQRIAPITLKRDRRWFVEVA